MPTPESKRVMDNPRNKSKRLHTKLQAAKKHFVLPFGATKGGLKTAQSTADALGVRLAVITKATLDGCPHLPTANGTRYDLSLVINWFFNTAIEKGFKSIDEASEQIDDAAEALAADRRKKIASAKREELLLAKEEEKVAAVADLMHNFSVAAGNVSAGLAALKSKLPGDLAHRDESEIEEILETEINAVLESFAEYKHEYESAP